MRNDTLDTKIAEMPIKTNKPSKDEQLKALQLVKETYVMYKELTETYRGRMLDIYKTYSTFTQPKQADWQTSFKVNKAHEIVNKILPRIMAKNPRRLVTPRIDEFTDEDKFTQGKQRADRIKEMTKMSDAIQDYLSHIFDKYGQREPLRLRAKNMIIYGNSYAKIKFKYEIQRGVSEEEGKITEKVVGEYPTIEPKSWTDMYFDPRYVLLEDMPALVEEIDGVRLASLKRNKKYFNLDKIDDMPGIDVRNNDPDSYKKTIFNITGIDQTDRKEGVDKNSLSLRTFY